MSKELNALENLISEICKKCNGDVCRTKNNGACKIFQNYKFIETALKEQQERIEELEETNHLMFLREHKNEKKLKALEIIKEKYVIKESFDRNENPIVQKKPLSAQEFDLLKEVLK